MSKSALGPTQPRVQWVPGVLSPGVKRGRGVTLTTHPHLVQRSWMCRSYTSSPLVRLHRCVVGLFFFKLSILLHRFTRHSCCCHKCQSLVTKSLFYKLSTNTSVSSHIRAGEFQLVNITSKQGRVFNTHQILSVVVSLTLIKFEAWSCPQHSSHTGYDPAHNTCHIRIMSRNTHHILVMALSVTPHSYCGPVRNSWHSDYDSGYNTRHILITALPLTLVTL
jgi:hypothetical protein